MTLYRVWLDSTSVVSILWPCMFASHWFGLWACHTLRLYSQGFTYDLIFCRMLEDFDREIEHTDSRMRSLTARVNKAIKQSGSELLAIQGICRQYWS